MTQPTTLIPHSLTIHFLEYVITCLYCFHEPHFLYKLIISGKKSIETTKTISLNHETSKDDFFERPSRFDSACRFPKLRLAVRPKNLLAQPDVNNGKSYNHLIKAKSKIIL
ncbi:hypothetical protein HanRHA438_Chr10g0435601 [Helianthus annuus]|nr:hypothetical protein HanRHA438_Chr10g0435601 [Helianthus annuus]